jgi:hypothetical protein
VDKDIYKKVPCLPPFYIDRMRRLDYGELAAVWEFFTSVHVIRARSVCYPDIYIFPSVCGRSM